MYSKGGDVCGGNWEYWELKGRGKSCIQDASKDEEVYARMRAEGVRQIRGRGSLCSCLSRERCELTQDMKGVVARQRHD